MANRMKPPGLNCDWVFGFCSCLLEGGGAAKTARQAKAMASPRMMQMAASPAAPFPSPHTVPMPTIVEVGSLARDGIDRGSLPVEVPLFEHSLADPKFGALGLNSIV